MSAAMDPMTAALPAAVALVLGLALPAAVLPLLRRLGVVDVPGERSSHAVPTVRGMGLATAAASVLAVATAFALSLIPVDRSILLTVLLGMLASGALGWIEDYSGLAVRWRALCQLLIGLAVAGLLTFFLGTALWWIPVGAIAIAAYINVVNFMDGLNGISGLHGVVVGGAYAYAGWVTDMPWLTACGAAIGAAYLAFLPWNLGGRRVFLGDTGSYFLGGAIACCAVAAFLSDIYVEYVLSPLIIYLADTGFTLLKRIYRGEAWYRPHRQHVYQRLTDAGLGHLGSAAVVTLASLAVTVVSVLSLPFESGGVAGMGALVLCIVVLYLLSPRLVGAMTRKGAAA
ncbi:glycosyltransferase family 4 protein [Rothia sp. AR01]|uniref:Glycosyltransferase family 4 protein n=1 Tax=Rothia santali TaxID=2949643 RepID=A0A9X2HCV8_9MICC|nr:glycosyltransferase family 4 protein [Rothia santali]MCP3425955.1 glycosyltransferase family 4 protein [Rothia santali]